MQDMDWIMGYKDADLNINKGTQNQVLGVSSKDDESKLRGKELYLLVQKSLVHLKDCQIYIMCYFLQFKKEITYLG